MQKRVENVSVCGGNAVLINIQEETKIEFAYFFFSLSHQEKIADKNAKHFP